MREINVLMFHFVYWKLIFLSLSFSFSLSYTPSLSLSLRLLFSSSQFSLCLFISSFFTCLLLCITLLKSVRNSIFLSTKKNCSISKISIIFHTKKADYEILAFHRNANILLSLRNTVKEIYSVHLFFISSFFQIYSMSERQPSLSCYNHR